ncbi:MAG: hypothetical protein M3Y59_06020 [Myxococcota bacterium]|nr:hypothetical protein [Myxococcota bacterium]
MKTQITSKLFLITAALVSAGCTGGGSVYLSQALALGTQCEPGDLGITRGSLDIGQSSNYFVAFSVASNAVGEQVTIDGRPVNSTSANDFVGEEIVLNYAINGTALVPEQLTPATVVIPAGASIDDSFVGMNLLTAPAVAALRAQTYPVDVVVSVFIRGAMRGGGPSSTNTVRFPITITGNTAPVTSCTAPAVLTQGGAPTCGNPSQDDPSGIATCVAP